MVAAAFLVTLKLVAGLISGSLGLVAEAVHSGTDLVAALLTFLALRVAIRPPDRDHPYGHGKAEHLAALGGRPGVYSARFAGEDATDEENLAKLLREAPAGSALAYVCVIALVDPVAGTEALFEGRCTGTLAAQPRGDGGFGYDPAFLPDDEIPPPAGRTMAQLSPAEKGAISHRGRAAALLAEHLGP